MNLQDWGAIGEVVGALAVVITLIYLAKQIGQNTHAMEEARKLALAQTYQMRSDALQAMLVHAAPDRFAGAVLHGLIRQGVALARRPLACVPALGDQRVVFARVPAQHDAQQLVLTVGRAPGAHLCRQITAHATNGIIHRALNKILKDLVSRSKTK